MSQLQPGQVWQTSGVHSGLHLLDFTASEEFIREFFLGDLDQLFRVGVDGASIRKCMQKDQGDGSAVTDADSKSVWELTYIHLSPAGRHDLDHYLVIGLLEAPETADRLQAAMVKVRRELIKLIRDYYLHGDGGFVKKVLRIADCGWCAVGAATLRSLFFNSRNTSTADAPVLGFRAVISLWHWVCVIATACVLGHPTPEVRKVLLTFSTFDVEKRAVTGEYDGLSIKEFTVLAESPPMLRRLQGVLPKDIGDLMQQLVDLRLAPSALTPEGAEKLYQDVFQLLSKYDTLTSGCHVGVHIAHQMRTITRGSAIPLVEQGTEHICQEMITLRGRHNLFSPLHLVRWRNACHFPLTTAGTRRMLLPSPLPVGIDAIVPRVRVHRTPTQVRLLLHTDAFADLLKRRTGTIPLIRLLSGHLGPAAKSPSASLAVYTIGWPVVAGYAAALLNVDTRPHFDVAPNTQPPPALYIFDLFVAPPHRNQGLGISLLEIVLRVATQEGFVPWVNSPTPWTSDVLKAMPEVRSVHVIPGTRDVLVRPQS